MAARRENITCGTFKVISAQACLSAFVCSGPWIPSMTPFFWVKLFAIVGLLGGSLAGLIQGGWEGALLGACVGGTVGTVFGSRVALLAWLMILRHQPAAPARPLLAPLAGML
jgi:hypothetical protein